MSRAGREEGLRELRMGTEIDWKAGGQEGREDSSKGICTPKRMLEQRRARVGEKAKVGGEREKQTYHEIHVDLAPGRRPHRPHPCGVVDRGGEGKGRERRQVDPLPEHDVHI
jgi:hypothetical protein